MDKQTSILIASHLGIADILNFSSTHSQINRNISRNPYFWINKLSKDFNFIFKGIPQTENVKQNPRYFYLILSKNGNFWSQKRDDIIVENIKNGNRDFVIFLLQKPFRNNKNQNKNSCELVRFRWSLYHAAKRNDQEVISLLENVDPRYTEFALLEGYTRFGNLDKVKELLEKRIQFGLLRDVDFEDLLKKSIKSGNANLIKYIIEKNYERWIFGNISVKNLKKYEDFSSEMEILDILRTMIIK